MLKGLASDGGLFIPEEIPSLPADWETKWRNYSFQELAFEIFSLYIAPSEIPPNDLKDIIARSYGTFRYGVRPASILYVWRGHCCGFEMDWLLMMYGVRLV